MRKKQNNVLIDATPAINDIRAIRRYCHHLVLELDQLETELQFQLLYLAVQKNSKLPLTNSHNMTQRTSRIPGQILTSMWKHFNAPKISHWVKEPIDLVHFPGGLPYIPTNCPKILTTSHGFHYHLIPNFMNNKNSMKIKKKLDFTMTKSTHFITVSEANKTEVIKLWNIPPEKITAIPLGISPEFKIYDLSNAAKQSISKRYNLPSKPFILFVGALEPHKNIKNIILAYSQLPSTLKNKYQLVLVGRETSYCEEYRNQITSLGLSDKVSFVDYIQPGTIDLAYLYNMARVFVFPTFYEGWASPPLEAMKCGTPAVVSDIPSLKESTGEISLYPDPHNPDAISSKIQELLEDNNFHDKQQEKGKEFAEKYTWKRCAESTLALYNQLVN